MEILYISSTPSKKQFDFMKKQLRPNIDNTKYGMQESGYKFHHLILDGIASDKNNNIYSLIGRPTSLKVHHGIVWKESVEKEKNITYYHIGFLNIPILKNIIVAFKYFLKTLKWLKKHKNDEKCIIIDASYVTVLPFINIVTKIKKCKKVAIVCDIYEYMADVRDSREVSSKLHKIVSKIMKKQYEQIDGFVFLTEAMNDVLNKKNKPYIVMEGLVDINMNISDNNLKNKNVKDVVMYAGAIREKYGLKKLINGYHKYDNENSELWIYGSGDFVPEVKKMSDIDNRIKYFGIVTNK